jgi:hypothetical protein
MMTQPTTEVTLDGPDTYHTWFFMIKGSIPRDLWKYIDLETDAEYEEPEEVTYDTIRPGATSLRELTVAEKTLYSSLRTSSKYDRSQYQQYLGEETKIRNKIMSTTTVEATIQQKKDEWNILYSKPQGNLDKPGNRSP